jgi:hypothetical protein
VIDAQHLGGLGLVAAARVEHQVDVLLLLAGQILAERRPVLEFAQAHRQLLRGDDPRLGGRRDLGHDLAAAR